MYDIGIIGSGPAALSAAVNARQRNKSVCVFGRSLDSSLLFAAEKVDNYLGMPDVTGEEMRCNDDGIHDCLSNIRLMHHASMHHDWLQHP